MASEDADDLRVHCSTREPSAKPKPLARRGDGRWSERNNCQSTTIAQAFLVNAKACFCEEVVWEHGLRIEKMICTRTDKENLMADKIDDGGSAFAHMAADGHGDYRPGLTKREYFAAPRCQRAYTNASHRNVRDGETMEQMFARKSFRRRRDD